MGGVIVVKAVVEQGKGARLYCERIITKFLQVFSPYITGLWVFRQTDRSRSIQSLPYHLGLYKSIRNIPP